MTAIEVLNIEEAGSDYVRLRDGVQDVRINFADDEAFSKEERTGQPRRRAFCRELLKLGKARACIANEFSETNGWAWIMHELPEPQRYSA